MTLVTYTVPVGKTFKLDQAFIGGNGAGVFKVKVNSSTVLTIRNSGSIRTVNAEIKNPMTVSAGGTVDIVAENIEELTKSYEATLGGYTIDA